MLKNPLLKGIRVYVFVVLYIPLFFCYLYMYISLLELYMNTLYKVYLMSPEFREEKLTNRELLVKLLSDSYFVWGA